MNCTRFNACAAGTHSCSRNQVCVYHHDTGGHTCETEKYDVCAAGAHSCSTNQVCVYHHDTGGHTCETKKPYSRFGHLQNDGTYKCPSWLQAANIGEPIDGKGPTISVPDECRCTRRALEYDYMVPAPQISACVNRNGFSEQSVSLIVCGVLLFMLPGLYMWLNSFSNACLAVAGIMFMLCGSLMVWFGARDKQCFNGVNECALGTHACPPSFKCYDTDCGYYCQCPSSTYETTGSSGDGIDPYYCADVDECARDWDNCKSGYRCNNNWRSYTCDDINECRELTNPCKRGYYCVNTAGSYDCYAGVAAFSVGLFVLMPCVLALI